MLAARTKKRHDAQKECEMSDVFSFSGCVRAVGSTKAASIFCLLEKACQSAKLRK
jgi:hypothetical protein